MDIPFMCSWKKATTAHGKFPNTPTTWSIYIMGLNFALMAKNGLDFYEK